MLKRSIKYFILLLINVIVIWALIPGDNTQEDVFDTAYVIDLLDKKSELENVVKDMSADRQSLLEQATSLQSQLDQTRTLTQKNIASLAQCQAKNKYHQSLLEEQQKQREQLQSDYSLDSQQCADTRIKLKLTNQELERLRQQLLSSQREARELNEKRIVLERELESTTNQDSQLAEENQALLSKIKTLEDDLHSDIYVKKIYTTPIYCDKPRFDELVCLQRLLVRPEFSKKPISNIEISLKSPSGKTIGSFTLSPTKAKLVNFGFANDSEQSAGNYTIQILLDDLIVTEVVELRQ